MTIYIYADGAAKDTIAETARFPEVPAGDPFDPSNTVPPSSAAPRELAKMHPESKLAVVYDRLGEKMGRELFSKLEECSTSTKDRIIPFLMALANRSSEDSKAELTLNSLASNLLSGEEPDVTLWHAFNLLDKLFLGDSKSDSKFALINTQRHNLNINTQGHILNTLLYIKENPLQKGLDFE